MSDFGGDDPIYRGNTPQDGVPWNSAGNQQPPNPPIPSYSGGPTPAAPKKKRWPWVLGLLVVFCGLPLGGCVSLLGLGVFSLNQTSDEISGTVEEFFTAAAAGDLDQNRQFFDGEAPCASRDAAIEAMDSFEWSAWDVESVSFTERDDNSSTSWNADAETEALDGRPTESIARAIGVVTTEDGQFEFKIFLSKPVATWRICTVELV